MSGTASHISPDSIYAIDEVVVHGKIGSVEIIPSQELSGDLLKKLSAYSVADAIRYFSGVQIKDYGGIGGLKTVNIRSMGSQHTGVFYDGIQLGNAQNGQIDLGRFSLDNMESLSLYNGQKSSLLQSAKDFASAGSIYLKTRKPAFEGEERNHYRISLKGGSFGTVNPSFLWEHRLHDSLNSSFNAEWMYTTGKYRFSYQKKNGYDTTEIRKNGDVNAFRTELGLFGSTRRGKWNAKCYFYRSERGYPGASVREEPGKFRHEDRQWDTNLFLQGSFRRRFSPRYSLLLNGKYAYDYLHYLSDPRLDASAMYVNNRYKQHEAYLSAAHELILSGYWQVNLATDFQYNTLDANLTDFAYPSRYTFLAAAATTLHFKRFKLQGSLLYTHVDDKTKSAGAAAGQKNILTPTLVAFYQPWEAHELNLRAFYKRIFRMPTLNDLYYTFIGNKYLDPEYTIQYNAGISYAASFPGRLLKRIETQGDLYFNRVEDKIIAMPTSNQFRWTMLNLGYVEIRGLDLSVQGFFQSGKYLLSARLNYTYQKAQDFTPDEEWYGGQIPYIPWHSGSFILSAAYSDWDLNYSFIYTGERYESSANTTENYAQPWYTHDLSFSRNIRLKTASLQLALEINNLLNQQYEVVQCYPMPGTNLKIKINLSL